MANREHALQVVLGKDVATFAFDAESQNYLLGSVEIPLRQANHCNWDVDAARIETTEDLAKEYVVIDNYGYPYVMPGLSVEFLPHTVGIDQLMIDAARAMHEVSRKIIESRIGTARAAKNATEFHPTFSPYVARLVPGSSLSDDVYFPDLTILTHHTLFHCPMVDPGREGFEFGIAGYNYNNAHGDDFDGMTLPLLAGLGHIAHVANRAKK